MPESTVFRERIVQEVEAEPSDPTIIPPPEGGNVPARPQDTWESESGKYISKLFEIEGLEKTMPLKIQYGMLNNYVQSELDERGWEGNKKNWQAILSELEGELGTGRLETYARMKKIADYLMIQKKYKEIKEKRDSFRNLTSGSK